eukprot:jgi/Orpsp1_1/1188400/evm.model.d7180000064490.1
MKKISKKLFNSYHKNTKKNGLEKSTISLKKEQENIIKDSLEEIQDSEQNQIVNEEESINSNEGQSIVANNNNNSNNNNDTILGYQLQEQNLEFGIIQCSSNQGVFSPFKLSINNIDSKYKSWISSKNCQYPQYITLQLINGTCQINNMQILFHQHFIPSKVELFLGNFIKMPNFEDNSKHIDKEKLHKSFVAVEFERIGYFTLYNNQQINNTARELKSITLNKKAQYIKLVLHECYKNNSNINNQVGIVSIRVNGIPSEIEKLNQQSLNETINNKLNSNLISNNKKSENLTPEQKNIPSKQL